MSVKSAIAPATAPTTTDLAVPMKDMSDTDLLTRLDADIASMRALRKEFAARLAKAERSSQTKQKRAAKRATKKEAEASGVKPEPKAKTSAWQAFSGGDEERGVEPAYLKYAEQYAAYLATLDTARGATIKFAKVARSADYATEDYAALEVTYAALAAERKSTSTSSSKKRKLTDEEKEANKAARSKATEERRAAKALALKKEKAAATPAKSKPATKLATPTAKITATKKASPPPAPKKAAKKAAADSDSEEETVKPKSKSKSKKVVDSEDEEEAKPAKKSAAKKPAAKPKPAAKKPVVVEEDEDVALVAYEYEGRSVLRTDDDFLFENDGDDEPGEYIGKLLDAETGEVDASVSNPFMVA